VMVEWGRLVQEAKQERTHDRAHAVVELTLQQWDRGAAKGLMATVLSDWHRAAEVHAEHDKHLRN
ncbi:unnamed protein product, partial [Polarella glacialis]